MNPAAPSPSDSSIAQAFRDYQAKWPGNADTGMAGWIERRARQIDASAPAAAVGGEDAARKLYEPDDYADAFKGRATPAAPVGGFVVDGDYVLPCDVKVWPATTISKGCKLSTLIRCIQLRDCPDPFASADYEQLGELLKPCPTAQPSAKDGVRGEAVELTKCCGREECGGECGNEWRGTEWVRKATTASGLVDDAMVERFREAMRDSHGYFQALTPGNVRTALEAAIGREVGK